MERDLGVLVEGQLKSIVCSGSQEYPGVYHAQRHQWVKERIALLYSVLGWPKIVYSTRFEYCIQF